MVSDKQVKELKIMVNNGKTIAIASMKTGMSINTAKKYLDSSSIPSQMQTEHTWRTREDPFEDVWDDVEEKLQIFHKLEAKTIFWYLQQQFPGKYQDGQLRTLQRRVKIWRATEGPSKEVYFCQDHHPGVFACSDFTHMDELKITINGVQFDHLLYHFVLSYSNWEDGTICFSESFESLSFGLQNAFWKLGGVTEKHRTDNLSAAFNNLNEKRDLTTRYKALLDHYGVKGEHTQPSSPNENGDVEQSNYRFKNAVDQALMLRGNRDFDTRDEYKLFLKKMFIQLNAGRQNRLAEELSKLSPLPVRRTEDYKLFDVKVGPNSTIRVQNGTYSVHSRLIGEKVTIRLYMDYLEVWYAQKCIEKIPRLRGEGKFRINYRHIIDSLVRKPGAFANYRYREELFPTSQFKIAYDILKEQSPIKADKEYLKILYMAAKNSETVVERALWYLINKDGVISVELLKQHLKDTIKEETTPDPVINGVDLKKFDALFHEKVANLC
jgi:hypothetical protein